MSNFMPIGYYLLFDLNARFFFFFLNKNKNKNLEIHFKDKIIIDLLSFWLSMKAIYSLHILYVFNTCVEFHNNHILSVI